tara:strand:- start:14 stop:313 length:300 start_codon:yes stop_codon:yes gene_type:complete
MLNILPWGTVVPCSNSSLENPPGFSRSAKSPEKVTCNGETYILEKDTNGSATPKGLKALYHNLAELDKQKLTLNQTAAEVAFQAGLEKALFANKSYYFK